MEYPRSDDPPETWIEWYRWKLDDMDRLLQAAYREVTPLRAEIEQLRESCKTIALDKDVVIGRLTAALRAARAVLEAEGARATLAIVDAAFTGKEG